MKTSAAKKLINTELTKLMGFEMSLSSEFDFLAVGVKLGKLTPAEAAKRIIDNIKF